MSPSHNGREQRVTPELTVLSGLDVNKHMIQITSDLVVANTLFFLIVTLDYQVQVQMQENNSECIKQDIQYNTY